MREDERNDENEELRRGSGEELIDEQGRNPTQQRMDEEGVESRPVDGPEDAMQVRQASEGRDAIGANEEDVGDVIA